MNQYTFAVWNSVQVLVIYGSLHTSFPKPPQFGNEFTQSADIGTELDPNTKGIIMLLHVKL